MHQQSANSASKNAKKRLENRGTITLSEYRIKRQSTVDALSIKKEFYGLEEARTFLTDLWLEYRSMIINFWIVFFYYLLGGWYFSKPDIMNKPMGTPDDSASIAMVCMYYITVTVTSVGYGDYFPVDGTSRGLSLYNPISFFLSFCLFVCLFFVCPH